LLSRAKYCHHSHSCQQQILVETATLLLRGFLGLTLYLVVRDEAEPFETLLRSEALIVQLDVARVKAPEEKSSWQKKRALTTQQRGIYVVLPVHGLRGVAAAAVREKRGEAGDSLCATRMGLSH
jgi:hypothetical protein